MRNIPYLLFIFYPASILAQTSYRITYSRNTNKLPFTVNGREREVKAPEYVLVFNDSLSVFHIKRKGLGNENGSGIYGDPVIHHAVYVDNRRKKVYDVVNYGKKSRYLIKRTIESRENLSWNSRKNIAGFVCKPAMYISGKNDTLLVWYSTEIKQPFGPSTYMGYPGLVLEVYDQQYGLHYCATSIEKNNFYPRLPGDVRIVTTEEYSKLRKPGKF